MSLNLCCENIFLIGAKLLQLEILSLKLSAMWNFKVCTDWSKLIMLNENWKQTWEQEYANEFKVCQSSDFGWITSNPSPRYGRCRESYVTDRVKTKTCVGTDSAVKMWSFVFGDQTNVQNGETRVPIWRFTHKT